MKQHPPGPGLFEDLAQRLQKRGPLRGRTKVIDQASGELGGGVDDHQTDFSFLDDFEKFTHGRPLTNEKHPLPRPMAVQSSYQVRERLVQRHDERVGDRDAKV